MTRTTAGVAGFLPGERVELPSHPLGVSIAALLPVQIQRFLPRGQSLFVMVQGSVRVAEVVESVGDVVGVAEGAEQREGLLVVVDRLPVPAGVVVSVPQTVQSGRRAVGTVVLPQDGEGTPAVFAGGVVVAEPGRVPADLVERHGFPDRLVERAAESEGASGVVQGCAVIALP